MHTSKTGWVLKQQREEEGKTWLCFSCALKGVFGKQPGLLGKGIHGLLQALLGTVTLPLLLGPAFPWDGEQGT